MQEEWKDIKGFEGCYQVSNFGQVKSLPQKRRWHQRKPYLLSANIVKNGYCLAHLYIQYQRKAIPIHRLVALAFIPNPSNKPQVNHKDGNKQNNKVDNLEWVTKAENGKHAFRNGFLKLPPPKLNQEDVIKIGELYPRFSQRKIAKIFNVSRGTISDVINKKYWICFRPWPEYKQPAQGGDPAISGCLNRK